MESGIIASAARVIRGYLEGISDHFSELTTMRPSEFQVETAFFVPNPGTCADPI